MPIRDSPLTPPHPMLGPSADGAGGGHGVGWGDINIHIDININIDIHIIINMDTYYLLVRYISLRAPKGPGRGPPPHYEEYSPNSSIFDVTP